ncbi:uncharacterized protein LOC106171486 [Lingula anatina]|uniref:Uncharacterized protein LOC106171486 n=1 Tax=Lingula anatina TaxID=7574 RepID=A0A1S3JA84_LINAN|nr:uncharacterized protein LOC106171486 [Lingula anatina]|eukprot:XP_013407312.1 uncharacterized protein LOC106171486 [Lingula anatina]
MLTVCLCVLSFGLLVNCNIDVPDNSGKEFIIAFMDNTFINNDSLNVFLTTDFPSPVQVHITAHSSYLHHLPQSNKTVSVRRGSITRVNIPDIFAMKDTNRSFKGIRLSADKEFIVYGSNAEPYSLDAFVALPVDILGQEYIAGSYSDCSSNFPALVGLVGVHNNTHIEITPANGTDIIVMGNPVNYKTQITLNRLETIQIASTSDITGTRINSSKPLAVMSGNKCAKVPCGHLFSCDHLVEQMYPVDRWGYTYTVVPSAYRQSGDTVRVVGSTDDTVVDITGISRLILHRSEFYEFNVSKNAPVYVNASKPIMVLQFTQSQDTDGQHSDPYMMSVPAIEQFSTSYTIATANLPDKVYKNFVNIVIKSSSKEGLRVDGAALNGVTWLAIPGTDFTAAQLNITEGTHRIEHISPIQTFSVFSYGFAESVSYGYPGGLRLANLDMTKCVPNTGQPADGVDNDCDMKIDEELFNGIDDDDDGVIDEDLSSLPPEVDFPKDAVIVSGNASVILYLMGQLSSPNVTSSERCTVYSNVTVNYTDSTNDNGCGVDIKRTWLVQDGCGNIVRSVQTILVYNSWQALRAHPGQNCTGMVEVVGCNDTADAAGQCTTAPCQGSQGLFMLAGGLGCYCARSLDNAWCLQVQKRSHPGVKGMEVLTVCFCVLSFGLLVNCNIDVPDNSGKEFIIAFMDNTFINNDSLNVFLTTDFPSPVQVHITAHSSYLHHLPQSNKTVSVRRGSITRVNIPDIFAMKDTNRSFKGVRLSADKEFIVYGSNAEPYSLDAFVALPVDILGQEYIAGSYSDCSSNFPALVGLVGVHNNTHIEITPANGTDIIVMGNPVNYKTQITLNRLETIQIASTSDITGTRINSSKPLAVMSGNKCAKVPCGHSFSCDHLVEYMYPVDRWGYTFTVVPSAYRQSGDIIRVVGSTDDTVVDITGVSRLILNRSGFYEFNVSKNVPVFVNASKPIMVLQFTQSQDTDGLDSDPYMMVVPAIEQFSTSYTIATANLPDKVYKNFVNIVIKSSSKEGLRVDGAALNGVTWLAIPRTDFTAAQLNITAGTHRIEHISPIQTFSVFSYGFAKYVSYGYPGGLRLANLDMG